MKKLPDFFSIKTLLILSLLLVSIGLIAHSIKKTENFGDDISMKKNSKIVVLIHGYPEPLYKDHPIYKYFDERGYSIVAPYLFSQNFKLTQEEVKKYIEEKLGGREPDVIVGVSLGGLIAPYLAKDFPKAKLMLVATGPYVKTNITPLNSLIPLAKTLTLPPIYSTIVHTPTWFYSIIYKLFNSPKLNSQEMEILENHIRQNWNCLTKIPASEDREMIDLLISTDNTLLLHSLKNKTIIFSGSGDIMMPPELSVKMKDLIGGSSLVISNDRLHFNVFNEENYKQLDDFLSGKVK
jgi:pimeloyl-ACP methyl ester carboxylesterase